jgi:probable F420-dependent oxidoreductase
MKTGVAMFVTDETVHPAELGRLVEQRGFDSLFVPEHTHTPIERTIPHPLGYLREEHKRTLDPLVALTAAAMATTRLRIGTGILLVPQHDPIVLAKAIASLDLVSDGRVLFGVGAGWNVDEMRNHGTAPATRFASMRERVLAMRAIWTEDEPEFHGEHVDFGPIWSWPKPLTKPHPPVLMGGGGPKVLDRVLDYADGWVPNAMPFEVLRERNDELQRRAANLGRGHLPVSVFVTEPDDDILQRMDSIGIGRAVIWVDPSPRDVTEAALERIAKLVPR